MSFVNEIVKKLEKKFNHFEVFPVIKSALIWDEYYVYIHFTDIKFHYKMRLYKFYNSDDNINFIVNNVLKEYYKAKRGC